MFIVKLQMILNSLKLNKINKSSSLTYTQHIQINMKNWHAQQLDMTNFWVAAWLDDREVLRSSLFYNVCLWEYVYYYFFNGPKWNKYDMSHGI